MHYCILVRTVFGKFASRLLLAFDLALTYRKGWIYDWSLLWLIAVPIIRFYQDLRLSSGNKSEDASWGCRCIPVL